MKYFLLIKYKDGDEHKKFKLVDRVSSFWQKIGYRIGLTWNTLEDYKREARSAAGRRWCRSGWTTRVVDLLHHLEGVAQGY